MVPGLCQPGHLAIQMVALNLNHAVLRGAASTTGRTVVLAKQSEHTGAKRLHQEVDQHPHLGREVLAARVDRIDPEFE